MNKAALIHIECSYVFRSSLLLFNTPLKITDNIKKLSWHKMCISKKFNRELEESLGGFGLGFFGKLDWKLKHSHCLRAVWPMRTFNIKPCVFLKTWGEAAGRG